MISSTSLSYGVTIDIIFMVHQSLPIILVVVNNVVKFVMALELLLYTGENSQIPCFGKICNKLALFWKNLAIYYFFST